MTHGRAIPRATAGRPGAPAERPVRTNIVPTRDRSVVATLCDGLYFRQQPRTPGRTWFGRRCCSAIARFMSPIETTFAGFFTTPLSDASDSVAGWTSYRPVSLLKLNSIRSPNSRPRWLRTSAGIVTRPFDGVVAAVIVILQYSLPRSKEYGAARVKWTPNARITARKSASLQSPTGVPDRPRYGS